MKCVLVVLSFTSVCGMILADTAPDDAGTHPADDVRQREVRSFDGGHNYNRFFGQGLHSQKGNTMVNWNSLLSKRKRQMEFNGSPNDFGQGLGGSALQDWSATFGRDDRSFGMGVSSPLGGSTKGGRFGGDGMQNWRAFYSRHSRSVRSPSETEFNGSPNDFSQGLSGTPLQDWSATFGRENRAFGSRNMGVSSPLGGSTKGGRFGEDGMQNWRAFYSRHSRSEHSPSDS